ncbi:VOC family protein [Lutibacter citreus]|uniref:VOC family protein n=1 Tax=Lutibacter citreus TaxID=2138210 RepID=UPI000DBE1D6A|nr:VOC family protein [Lutibacter citreus]
MKLNHIALNIQNKKELIDFYQNIFGFHLEYQFDLNLDLAKKNFNIEKQPEVYLYKNNNLVLELFVYPESTTLGFAHICLEMVDREKIAKKGEQAGYPITRIQRNNKPDILFIKDKAENIFELKKVNS